MQELPKSKLVESIFCRFVGMNHVVLGQERPIPPIMPGLMGEISHPNGFATVSEEEK
jgi:hypothetical protein